MSDATSSKTTNLARIRDNQRRSRARRKEYLQEIETKLRHCEQMGVEASAEIQSAARKVLEENKRLRALLRERGVSESEIHSIMGTTDRMPEYASPAPMLEAMLGCRRPCNTQSLNTTGPVGAPPTSMPMPSPSVSIPYQRAIALQPRTGSASPHSLCSSVDTPSSISTPTFSHIPMATSQDLSDTDSLQHLNYQYDQSLNTPWNLPQDRNFSPDQMTYSNTSSCVYAANIIRSMRSDVGMELEADLGCRELGTDCSVDNSVVFNVMEKYSTQSPM
ncbi:hypothetical protein K432DRAFT_379524 [Lepidopterella palustris CBS 459.81]|uniref:BZIP domain-containing protein n=1 Tax=Lepidopterella palustris CBS 459.81 TaxID=1314670 RepID=A0A8E2JIE0_9PEZI|nr:hypothetical protein K432DRAFT_379524 [Lepidopterella palustris CBS 459.81]